MFFDQSENNISYMLTSIINNARSKTYSPNVLNENDPNCHQTNQNQTRGIYNKGIGI